MKLFPAAAFLFLTITLQSQTPQSNSAIQQHIQRIQSALVPQVVIKNDPRPAHSLADRMAALHIPGVSVAVLHNGQIEWAQGFGVTAIGGPPVTVDTLFQAGSISKPVAALATLHLVQQGKLALDTDINTYLTSWKFPLDKPAQGNTITLRELLTHTAGTTVHGFPGYASNEPVPTVVQVLNGEKPANTAAIRSEAPPNVRWNYSGGGFTIMQQTVIDVSKETYPKLLQDIVLTPIGMTSSTYEQPLPPNLRSKAATPYDDQGKAIPGGAHTYPEMAAAGLWTTPTDLCRYMIEIQTSLQGKSNHVLSKDMTEQMLKPGMKGWGLGVETGGSATDPYFTHGGVNEGFESLFAGYDREGNGAAIMTNAAGGSFLAEEIMRSIAAEYNWPDFKPILRTTVPVDQKILSTYIGTYQLAPNFTITISLEDNKLTVAPTNQPKLAAYPESENKFFLIEVDAEFEFVKDAQGKVTEMILHQNGHDTRAPKQ